MPATRTIVVAGAGIGGLTLALALAKFGARVIVLERSRSVPEVGAGLQISPNAFRILDQLGLGHALREVAFAPEGIDVFPAGRKSPLVTLELGAEVTSRFGAPYLLVHRADLADVLQRACRRFAGIDINFESTVASAESNERGVALTIDQAGIPRQARALALVGADGVQSRTRTAFLNGAPAQKEGYVTWRALVPWEKLGGVIASDRTSLLFGPGFHAVCYPLPHRHSFNVALFTKEPRSQAVGVEAPDLPKASLRGDPLKAVLAAAAGEWTKWPLSTVNATAWHAGNIGLLGDAAHAMLPFQAQGAAMAIEDAAVLAPLLMSEPDGDGAFSAFFRSRRPRVDRVARVSRANARIFHMRWPFTLGRNTAMRLGGTTAHLNRLAWLYGYDVGVGGKATTPATKDANP